jgi:hypothetical protein
MQRLGRWMAVLQGSHFGQRFSEKIGYNGEDVLREYLRILVHLYRSVFKVETTPHSRQVPKTAPDPLLSLVNATLKLAIHHFVVKISSQVPPWV